MEDDNVRGDANKNASVDQRRRGKCVIDAPKGLIFVSCPDNTDHLEFIAGPGTRMAYCTESERVKEYTNEGQESDVFTKAG
jgi:hypothetical protein